MTNDVNDATSDSDDDIDEEDEEQKYQLTQWFPSDFSATDQVPALLLCGDLKSANFKTGNISNPDLLEGQIGFQLVRL